MNREQAINYMRSSGWSEEQIDTVVSALTCEDAISRQAALDALSTWDKFGFDHTGCFVREPKDDFITYIHYDDVVKYIKALPSVSTEKTQKIEESSFDLLCAFECGRNSVAEKTGRCKDCKYFEYDSVAKVDGIPLIVAHEICSRWGDGCKTREDGYCFLYEPQESEG